MSVPQPADRDTKHRSPLLILITGAPSTGKTTLGQRIGHELALPFFYKDGIKETLFDAVGWSDLAWSRKVGAASIALLFAIAEAQLAAGRAVIIESNFRPEFDTPRALDLLQRHPCKPFQIFCQAAPDTLMRRFQQRWESGARHPGHIENEQLATFAATHLDGSYTPLAIGGSLHTLDTTDFTRLDLDLAPLFAALRAALADTADTAE